MAISGFGPNRLAIYGRRVVLAASAARTTSASGAHIQTRDDDTARLTLNVTASGGTGPTLDVDVETSSDGSSWSTAGSFAQATGTGSQRLVVSNLDRFVRANWSIGGTGGPTFTFSVAGEMT